MDPEAIRFDAAARARKRKKGIRLIPHSPDCPCQWQPGRVINPEDNQPFTEERAWIFLAELLESGTKIEVVELQNGYGKNRRAFVLKAPLGTNELYVKFQLGSCQIIGRSFHYCEIAATIGTRVETGAQ
jgi:hypothetical protein